MDINKNQQVNTFLKGMNTDLSDSLLGNSQYRYAENVRISTNTESNSGELRLVDGTVELASFTDKIIYINSIREYVVVITQNTDDNTWSIYVNDNKGIEDSQHLWTLIFGPCETCIWEEGKEPSLCGVLRWESDNNVKLYLTDNTGYNGIMLVQISRDKWPQTPSTDFNTLYGYQDTLLSCPEVQVSSSVGTLNPAKVLYAYRLFKTGGASTTISPLSKTISLRKNDQGYSYSEKSNKAVDITINMSNSPYLDLIQLFRINYVLNGQAPTIHKICEKVMTLDNDVFTYTDHGSNIEQISLSEFLSYVSMEIRPKVIESKGDTLFAGNIEYGQDDIDKDFEDYDTRSFSSGNYWDVGLGNSNPGISFEQPTAESSDTGGFAIEGNGPLCHKQFDGLHDEWNIDYWRPIPYGIPDVTKIGGHGTNIDWELKTKNITFNSTTGEITSVIDQTGPRTYKHDETYRFGIILYNDKGKASSVKWICDIRIPPLRSGDITINGNNITMKQYYIDFTLLYKPEKASAYQIVQCPRTMSDRHIITQGIVGRPFREQIPSASTFEYSNYICPTGIMTMQEMTADNMRTGDQYFHPKYTLGSDGLTCIVPVTGDLEVRDYSGNGRYIDETRERVAASVQDVVLFTSPEYVYLSDDIKDIISTYKSLIKIEHIAAYDTAASAITQQKYNIATVLYGYTTNSISTIQTAVDNNGVSKINTTYISPNQPVLSNMAYRYHMGIYPNVSSANIYTTFLSQDFNTVSQVLNNNVMLIGVNRLADESRLDRIDHVDGMLPEYHAFNFIKPASLSSQQSFNVIYPNIDTVAYVKSPEWNTFANGDNMRFMDDITPIGSYSYINWSAPLMLDMSPNGTVGTDNYKKMFIGDDIGVFNTIHENYNAWANMSARAEQPLGTGGKCMLIKFDNKLRFGVSGNYSYACLRSVQAGDTINFAPIHIANITKLVIPYGGYNKHAIESSTYIGNGYFSLFNDQSNTISVNNGDAYLGIFKYNASHLWKDGKYFQALTKLATVYNIPIESDIDLTATYGQLYDSTVSKSYYIQDKPASFDGYSQEKEAYMYNTAYNQTPNVMTYSPTVYTEISNYNWDTRIHNSDLKTNGETIDSWLTFKAMNFLDVDSRYGEITDMKLFKDKLLFWQDKAFGVVSSNERTAITDTDNNLIILGNGGVLQRFDYISTVYGMKPDQFVSTQSNHNLYFWDGHEKEILAYGESLVPLTTVKGIRNHINNNTELDKPCMFYDNKNKEVVSSVVTGGSIAYSEQTEAFTSIYTYTPLYHTDVFEDMLSAASDNKLYLHNVQQDDVTLFGIAAKPKLQYVVNSEATMPKVFDIQTFGGRFYGGDDLSDLQFKYNTPLKQESNCTGTSVTNREYDFRLDIPRNNNDTYGGRMRGKTMQCELRSASNSSDFSLQYIITKYRMSWS